MENESKRDAGGHICKLQYVAIFLSMAMLHVVYLPVDMELRSAAPEGRGCLQSKKCCATRAGKAKTLKMVVEQDSAQDDATWAEKREQEPTLATGEHKETDSRLRDEVLLAELDKANKEIQARINEEFGWFRLKYYLVGSLLVGFVARMFLGKRDEASGNAAAPKPVARSKHDEVLEEVAKSSASIAVLAFGILIALTIDLQIRADRVMTRQLAWWIHTKVEMDVLECGWEQFLRLPGGHHTGGLFSVLFPSHVYAVTLLLYGLYLLVAGCANTGKWDSTVCKVSVGSFVAVHAAIVLVALYNVAVPAMFKATWILSKPLFPCQFRHYFADGNLMMLNVALAGVTVFFALALLDQPPAGKVVERALTRGAATNPSNQHLGDRPAKVIPGPFLR